MAGLRLLGLFLLVMASAGCAIEDVRAAHPLVPIYKSVLQGSPREIAFCVMEQTKNEMRVRNWGNEDGSIVKLQYMLNTINVFPVWEATLTRVGKETKFVMQADKAAKGDFASLPKKVINIAEFCGRG